ncbi:S-layer homology domain-containing protein [Paenibacillus sp. PDC88]|uniref:S-layer homology domain-containing protein n=1 Tax=Paenibacillus sp. PDC88 TaxID=1884375 RepID=UPI00089CCDCC|nr:S-layer homology domain-containing protein [Paenibacillus sp. PDC88]SDW60430.1 S-layer homology domain-containing protein [Paenibacillus sp. PDC88]
MTFKPSNINAKHSKKMVSAMLASLMALSAGAGAAGADTAPAAVTTAAQGAFSDVKSGYWAEKHIYKLASLDILVGDRGLFRPGDAVTKQEAVTIAIRFMNQKSNLPAGSSIKLPEGISTSEYAKSYVSLAFELGLLEEAEESKEILEKQIWGQQAASREWIAKLVIRAIGKEAEANAGGNANSSFADDSLITAANKPYVNLAAELEIAQGTTGNKFNPQGTVTRAEITAFFNRGSEYTDYEYDNQYKGYITERTDSKLTLYTGSEYVSFTVNPATAFYNSSSSSKIAPSDIKLYTQIVVSGSNSNAAYVESMSDTPQVEVIEGSFERLTGSKLWMFTGNTYHEFAFTDLTVFYDQNGQVIKPEDITAGSIVELQRETFTSAKNPVVVQVKSGMVNKSAEGTIQSIDSAASTVTVLNSTGTTDVLKVQEGTTVIRYHNEIVALTELKAGTVIKYSIKDSVTQSIEVTAGVERTVRGTLYELGSNLSTITYDRNGSLEVKLLAPDPQIVISGIDTPKLTDLLADKTSGDEVELTLNAEDQVTKIQVLNRQMEPLNMVTVVSYNSKTKLLTVLDSNQKPHVFTLNDATKVDYNSTKPTLSGIEPYLTDGRKVNLTTIGTRALSISIVYKYEGTVSEINTSSKIVKLIQSNGQTISIPYQSTPTVELYGKASASLSDVSIGDQVTAMLSSNQDNLSKLYVKSAAQFEVVSLNTSNYRAEVKKDGVTSSIYVDSLPITNDNGAVIKPSDLQKGMLINVSFDGSSPTAVSVVKQIWGEISSINGGVVTYKTTTGSNETINAGSKVKVVKNGTTSSSMSTLIEGDHVIVTKDADGTPVFQVLTPLSKTFWKYNAAANELQVKRASMTDNNYRFNLSPNVYIHEGDTTLSVQSLKDNDNIVVYLLNNVVIEISKQ